MRQWVELDGARFICSPSPELFAMATTRDKRDAEFRHWGAIQNKSDSLRRQIKGAVCRSVRTDIRQRRILSHMGQRERWLSPIAATSPATSALPVNSTVMQPTSDAARANDSFIPQPDAPTGDSLRHVSTVRFRECGHAVSVEVTGGYGPKATMRLLNANVCFATCRG